VRRNKMEVYGANNTEQIKLSLSLGDWFADFVADCYAGLVFYWEVFTCRERNYHVTFSCRSRLQKTFIMILIFTKMLMRSLNFSVFGLNAFCKGEARRRPRLLLVYVLLIYILLLLLRRAE
jgi:hypothetical protein